MITDFFIAFVDLLLLVGFSDVICEFFWAIVWIFAIFAIDKSRILLSV